MTLRVLPLLTLVLTAAACRRPATAPALPKGATATLAILETTDLHAHVRSYDYFKLEEDPSIGLERTATLIRQVRQAFPNTLLLDNGDTIQGSPMGDYQALVKRPGPGEDLAIFRVMGALGFDAATLGNHEFNYGLAYLGQTLGRRLDVDGLPEHPLAKGPNFPMVVANVLSTKTGQPLVEPYTLLSRTLQARMPDGRMVQAPLKVGVLGLTTPTLTTWDRAHTQGKVVTRGAVETARQRVPELKAKGADLVVVLAHGGIDGSPDRPSMENASLHVAKVPGVDAVLMGHTHQTFPDGKPSALPGVDGVKGTLHGTPAVMASSWGKALGVITFQLTFDGGRWQVDRTQTKTEVRFVAPEGQPPVPPDPTIAPLVEQEHQATLTYVKTSIGRTGFRISSAFADLGEVSSVQVINQAQAEAAKAAVAAGLPQLANLPVLSLCPPFKAGGGGSPRGYLDVPPGDLTLGQAANLYPFPNTLQVVKVDGAGLKAWLEHAARRFNRIDPARTDPQVLVARGPSYNFDMATDPDLQYEIDVTQPVGNRIRNLAWKGRPVDASLAFLVATNNYRAGGGEFPGMDGSRTVFESPDTNRDLLIAYVKRAGNLSLAAHGSARSWRFTSVKTAGPVVLHTAPGMEAFAKERGLPVRLLREDDGRGFSVYAVDLAAF